jgi:hypothetical protein
MAPPCLYSSSRQLWTLNGIGLRASERAHGSSCPRPGGTAVNGKRVAFERGKTLSVKSDVVTAVGPKYPIDERTNRHHGAGFFRMIMDPKTGLVTRVLVETSTGCNGVGNLLLGRNLFFPAPFKIGWATNRPRAPLTIGVLRYGGFLARVPPWQNRKEKPRTRRNRPK